MLLSYFQLKDLAKKRVIENVSDELINGSSIDVTLASSILIEYVGDHRPISLRNKEELPMQKYVMSAMDGYILAPGEFILASTQQLFNMPLGLSGEYKLKSSMARIGLNHLNAGWIDAGWHDAALTLELVNVSKENSIIIRTGDRIGQVVFWSHEAVPEQFSYKWRGRYNGDKEVSGVKTDRHIPVPVPVQGNGHGHTRGKK